jgi:hypothetical protein
MNLIRNTVTGQFLCAFVDDQITGRGKNSIPTWGDKATAEKCGTPASVEALAKCHLAGILCVEVAFAQ